MLEEKFRGVPLRYNCKCIKDENLYKLCFSFPTPILRRKCIEINMSVFAI